MNENELVGELPLSAGEGDKKRSGYGLPPQEEAAVERFFTELRETGRIRLACARAGWTRAKMEGWKQAWNEDGSENRRHRPAFARAVEAALCQFQSELIKRMLDDGEEGNSGRQRAAVWLLERMFQGEFIRGSETARAAEERRKQPRRRG